MTTLGATKAGNKPSVAFQNSMLACKEDDWRLPGTFNNVVTTRTRHGGKGRPQLSTRKKMFNEPESSESEEEDEDEENEELIEIAGPPEGGMEDDEEEENKPTKPKPTRAIFELDGLMETLESHCRCPQCCGPMMPSTKSICLASRLILTCTDSECGYVHESKAPIEATIGSSDGPSRDRSTDYAINVLYVLGFISMGDGCTEAARLLALLGLPNAYTMESRSFTIIEERISPYVKELTEKILMENLTEEVQRSVATPDDFKLWKDAQDPELAMLQPLPSEKYPKIHASYDMAWQQRNSGHTYNSNSGHALYVGSKTRKPISLSIKSKICNACSAYKKSKYFVEGLDAPLHYCTNNHDGTSGAMEPKACLDMTVDLYESKQCCIATICIDDDASTRSLMKWSNADWMKNNNTSDLPLSAITKGINKGKMQVRPDKGNSRRIFQSLFLLQILTTGGRSLLESSMRCWQRK
jgi:hypothetical protein